MQENISLMYFSDSIGYVYSNTSSMHKKIKMLLGLLILSISNRTLERLIHIRKISRPINKISLDTLYYVGKAMD